MISIITVVRNCEITIENTILSVINQEYKNFEYIIIDGKSTDNTLDVINKYKDSISLIISESDLGIYDAMNKGIRYSKGDWVYFLGGDDILYNNQVLKNIFYNKNFKNKEVIYGNVLTKQNRIVFDGQFDLIKHFNKSVCQQAIFYKKNVFNNKSFEIKYITTADYVFNIKHLSKNSTLWMYIPQIICEYNETGASFVKKDLEYTNNNFFLRFSNFKSLIPKIILARLIYPSFINYFRSHSFLNSSKNLIQFIKHVGLLRIIRVVIIGLIKRNG